jgi:spoIIIJ-associated protein
MVQEFEGRTEEEAIQEAIEALGIERDQFDVEILETEKAGFLNLQKRVRIRVQVPETQTVTASALDAENDVEHALVDFLENTTEKMGYPAKISIMYREPGKIGVRLDSEDSGMIIGKKGKNLDALQLLANVIVGRFDSNQTKVILDSENYRSRREEQIVSLAQRVGDQVKQSRKARLLDPMNPFERRLIHTTLNDVSGIATESEGDGLYKQVRVFYTGSAR